jgi:hypothetical protein
LKKAWNDPRIWVGIIRSEHASEDWKPSIIAHIELTRIENNRRRAAAAAHEPQPDLSDYHERRMARFGYSPAQKVQARYMRKRLVEFRAPEGK